MFSDCSTNPESSSNIVLAVDDRSGLQCIASIIAAKWAIASYSCISKSQDLMTNRSLDFTEWSLVVQNGVIPDNSTAMFRVKRAHSYAHVSKLLKFP